MKFKDKEGNVYETSNPVTIKLMTESNAYTEVKAEKVEEKETKKK